VIGVHLRLVTTLVERVEYQLKLEHAQRPVALAREHQHYQQHVVLLHVYTPEILVVHHIQLEYIMEIFNADLSQHHQPMPHQNPAIAA
jgi:hypothetical protein